MKTTLLLAICALALLTTAVCLYCDPSFETGLCLGIEVAATLIVAKNRF